MRWGARSSRGRPFSVSKSKLNVEQELTAAAPHHDHDDGLGLFPRSCESRVPHASHLCRMRRRGCAHTLQGHYATKWDVRMSQRVASCRSLTLHRVAARPSRPGDASTTAERLPRSGSAVSYGVSCQLPSLHPHIKDDNMSTGRVHSSLCFSYCSLRLT